MIIYQPWWQLLGTLLLIVIIGIIAAGLTGEEDADDLEQSPDTGSGDGGRQGNASIRYRLACTCLPLRLRCYLSALGARDTVRGMAGPGIDSAGYRPRKYLRGLTADEELELQRYLHLVRQTAGNADTESWNVSDMVHELAGLKARNTPPSEVRPFGLEAGS